MILEVKEVRGSMKKTVMKLQIIKFSQSVETVSCQDSPWKLLKKQVKREPMSIQSLVPNETLNVHDGTKISDGIGTSSGQVERMPELVTLSTNLYSDRQCPGSLEMLANLHSSPFEPRNSDISSGMDDESNNYEMVNSGLEIPNAGDGHTLLASALVFLATEIHNLSERPVSNPSNRSRIS